MARVWNFYPGPATLPEEVVLKIKEDLPEWDGAGMSVMELSHRSKEYDGIHHEAMDLVRELLGLDEKHHVLFLQGGASLQFAMVPMNFIPEGGSADYIITGSWSKKALKEAEIVASARVAASTEKEKFTRIPKQEELDLDPKAAYVHITSNNTIFGTQWHSFPDTGGVPLVADMSSDIMWRPFDANKFALIYAGAQKNLGPAGVTLVIVDKEWAEKAQTEKLPTLLRYTTHIGKDSLYNTPPCFAIYAVRQVLLWLKEKGGLSWMEEQNRKKGQLLYEVIDSYPEFYRCPVEKESRSYMNAVFRLPNQELEGKFLEEAKNNGFIGLKGHRSVGGCRVSMYNGMPLEGVKELARFMEEFARRHA